MYESLQIPWSPHPAPRESAYRSAGLVKTKGTIFLLPPSPKELRNAYLAPPRPQSATSAGAVALCKHFERGDASSEHGGAHPFWTLPKGSNAAKDEIALGILEEMLEDVEGRGGRWRNVILLHPGVAVYEIRGRRRWGMRWTLDVEAVGEDGDGGRETGEARGQDAVREREWRVKKVTFRGFWSRLRV
ncbi:hypothetical protein LTS18_006188 [Coniosporium uncinatum]|uniref:Uncharacterized protein n=1 Tax=Coniosporium uncinatum TaxID=93489 RepID=A0ACC3DD21_9PEZI|nr:hypothetical protein LTS18_006188 [Coniosporium uncinatum]